MYVLEERDDIIDFAKVYEKLTGEKYDESVQKEIEKVKLNGQEILKVLLQKRLNKNKDD